MSLTGALKQRPVIQRKRGEQRKILDNICVEEPLMLQVFGPDNEAESEPLLTIMRTPGNDQALIYGFLFAEGLITSMEDVLAIDEVISDQGEADPNHKTILLRNISDNLPTRRFSMSSSCGLCGRLMIDDIERMLPEYNEIPEITINENLLANINRDVIQHQRLYQDSGASHAASLFTVSGDFVDVAEDIGRHNAVDKLVGQALLTHRLPLSDYIMLISGRVSYELMQKAVMAGIQCVIAIGAPSSMALQIAQRFDITLIGFLKSASYTVYHGQWRIR